MQQHKPLQPALCLIIALATAMAMTLSNSTLVMAQNLGYTTVGGPQAVPVYVPGQINGVTPVGVVTPNYMGSFGHNAVYGDYNNPGVGYQVNQVTGQQLTYRPNAQTNHGRANYGNGRSGMSPATMIMGGGMLGIGALAVGSRVMSSRRANGPGGAGSPNHSYEKDMKKAEERRQKQHEKIQRELKQAHEADLKRKGIMPTSAQGPAPQDFNQGRPVSRARNSEDLEGDIVPASATQKLDF